MTGRGERSAHWVTGRERAASRGVELAGGRSGDGDQRVFPVPQQQVGKHCEECAEYGPGDKIVKPPVCVIPRVPLPA